VEPEDTGTNVDRAIAVGSATNVGSARSGMNVRIEVMSLVGTPNRSMRKTMTDTILKKSTRVHIPKRPLRLRGFRARWKRLPFAQPRSSRLSRLFWK